MLAVPAVFPALAQGVKAVSVRVQGMVGEELTPLAQMPVYLLQRRPSMNLPFPLPRRSEITGRDGWAHFHDVEPGVYSVDVRPVTPRDGQEGWLPQYGGGAPNWRLAETFAVRPGGAALEFGFVLQKGRPLRLTGRALNEEGRPAPGARISLTRNDLPVPPLASATSGPDGGFDFGFVFPDAYRIRGELSGQTADEPYVLPATGAPPAVLRLERTFALEGRVGGKELVAALPEVRGFRMHALPESGAIFNEGTAAVGPDGTFAFAKLAPGRYQLQPSLEPAGFYLNRIRLAGVDVLGETVELRRGYGPLEVEFESGPGSVTGQVEDDTKGEKTPAGPGSRVVLVSTDAKRRHFLLFIRTASVGEKGGFEVAGVAPGEYYAWAFDRFEARDLNDELLVERLKPSAETVKVVRNQATNVTLRLQMWELAAGT
jgi:hypothetical protein